MDFHQLYVFTKVVEHKSFSKAAAEIFLSQSTVSSHIQALEKSLGAKLFDRFGREIILTPSGERLYYWAQKILQLKDEALLDLNPGIPEIKGIVRAAVSSVPSQFILPKMMKQFREKYPHVAFHVNQSPSKIVAEKVQNGTVDLGILGEKYSSDRLHYIPLLKEKLVLITANQLDFHSPVNINNLIDYPFIMRSADSGTNTLLKEFLNKHSISREKMNIAAYIDDGQSLIQLVIQGIGISIISEIAAKGYAENKLLKMHEIENFEDERFFYLVFNKNKTLSVIAKLFIQMAGDMVL